MPRSSMRGSEKSAITGLNAYRNQLLAQRSAIDTRIRALEEAIRAMGVGVASARVGSTPTGRAPRKGSLKEHIIKVLSSSGKPMMVKEITAGVMKSGYKTENKTLAKSVGIALTQLPGVAKLGRGKFQIAK